MLIVEKTAYSVYYVSGGISVVCLDSDQSAMLLHGDATHTCRDFEI